MFPAGKRYISKQVIAAANAVAAGNEPFIPFIECEAGRQPVIYADLELSKRQFLNRYSSPDGMPIFLDRGLMRVELNYADWEILQTLGEKASFEEQLLDDIENMVKNTDIKVVVVDNITFLTACTEKSYDAMQLMKRLISLKQRYGVSLLILAHTPKRDKYITYSGKTTSPPADDVRCPVLSCPKICGHMWTVSRFVHTVLGQDTPRHGAEGLVYRCRRATPGINVMMLPMTYGCEPLTRLLP